MPDEAGAQTNATDSQNNASDAPPVATTRPDKPDVDQAHQGGCAQQIGNAKPWSERVLSLITVLATLIIAAATVVNVCVAIKQWNVGESTAETASGQLDTMRRDGRAWISPAGISFLQTTTPSPDVRIVYGNTGKEPALSTVQDFKIGSVEAPQGLAEIDSVVRVNHLMPLSLATWPGWKTLQDIDWHKNCAALEETTEGGEVVYPSANPYGEVEPGPTIPGIPPIDMEPVVAGEKIFYVAGCFKYRTIEQWHISAFCYYLSPDSGDWKDWKFRNCPLGNHAD